MKYFSLFLILFFLISLTNSAPSHEEFELNQNWKFKELQSLNDYLPAVVPGSVHLDLISNSLLPDPYYRDNEKYLAAFESASWEYLTSFSFPDSLLSYPNLQIIFEGLDTHTTIYFNENEILQTHDYFVEYQTSIKDLVKKENNTLKIVFESAIIHDEKKRISFLPNIIPADNPNRTPFSRKPRFHYGWDWGPRIVTAGIAKKIKIRGFTGFKIESLSFETIEFKQHNTLNQPTKNLIGQNLDVTQENYLNHQEMRTINNFNEFSTKNEQNKTPNSDLFDALIKAEFRLSLNKDEKMDDFFKKDVEIYFSTYINNKTLTLFPDVKFSGELFYFTFEISGIELWWSRGLGRQILYDFKITIKKNGVEEEINQRTGIRKVKLINVKDEIGESFLINLNGKNVFAKGANYIPPEYFEAKITQEKMEKDARDMTEANYNAIRVWGGGYFLPSIFYSLMDSAGIMVLHDLMFACEMYPATKEYLELYELEIKQNVEKLKSHPSIVLWIGNNEVNEAWNNWGFQSGLTKENKQLVWDWYLTLFHTLLPSLLSSHPYWPSSPLYGYGHPESLLSGDSHFWSVWADQKPISEYLKSGRFMSEYGMQGFPDRNTIFSFTEEKDRDVKSDVMKRHEKHLKGFENLGIYMEELFGYVPENYNDYSYLAQVLQSFAIKTAIESHRSSPYCMGTLYWQMNDIWPGITWSSVDYYGRYKALHYEVKNLYKDVVFVAKKHLHIDPKETKIYLINDLNHDIKGSIEIVTRNVKGERLESKRFDVTQESGTTNIIFTEKRSIPVSTATAPLFYDVRGEFVGKEGQKQEEEYGFMDGWPKEWGLIKAPKVKIHLEKGVIRVEGDVIVRYLYIFLEERYLQLDRNYFDVVPGKVSICKILNLKEIGEIKENDIKWMSLNDLLRN